MFANIVADIDSEANYGVRPFHLPLLYLLVAITAMGFQYLEKEINHRKISTALSIVFLLFPCVTLILNFSANNESQNYIAYDFSMNSLKSLPPRGYLLTIGRDNMTFPIYYLRKVEDVRPDIELEVYYGSEQVSENYLRERLIHRKDKVVFVDLAPEDFEQKGLKPFGFLYALGQTRKLNWQPPKNFTLRGIRENLDPTNLRLVNMYRAKMGILNAEKPATQENWFQQIIDHPGSNFGSLTFIADYSRNHGLFDMAMKAYAKANNQAGVQDIKDRRANPQTAMRKGYQRPMD